jgi:hypothetical protein
MTRGLQFELWRAKVPLSTIRNQQKVFERTLKRVMVFTKANSLNLIKSRKPMSGCLKKISIPTRIQEVIIFRGGNDQIPILLCPLNQSINF